jgi:hypothetical protein
MLMVFFSYFSGRNLANRILIAQHHSSHNLQTTETIYNRLKSRGILKAASIEQPSKDL